MTTQLFAPRRLRTAFLGLTVGLGLGLLIAAQPASAGSDRPTRPDYLMIRGSGSWAPSDGGGTATAPVEVWLPHSAEPSPAIAVATLTPLDGSFPGPEQCEAASATLETTGLDEATGSVRLGVGVSAVGTVCGGFVEVAGTFPTQSFTGRYVVIDGFPRFLGDDGFVQVQLYDGGDAYVFATDS